MNEETLEKVVFDGIRFLESLINHYGADKGMEVWEAMGEAVGNEVKGRIFFAMVSNNFTSRVKFRSGNAIPEGNAVAVIKTIRAYTGYGLKEAKDVWDNSKGGIAEVQGKPDEIRRLRMDLITLGCEVF